MLTPEIITEVIGRWIASCYTYEQLATCENIIQKMLIDRFEFCSDIEPLKQQLAGQAQYRRMELQLLPKNVLLTIRAQFLVSRWALKFD